MFFKTLAMVWEYTFTAIGSERGLRAVNEIERVAWVICHFDVYGCVLGGYSASVIGEEVDCHERRLRRYRTAAGKSMRDAFLAMAEREERCKQVVMHNGKKYYREGEA